MILSGFWDIDITNLRIIWGFKDVRPGYTKSGGFSDIKSTLTWLCVCVESYLEISLLSIIEDVSFEEKRNVFRSGQCHKAWYLLIDMVAFSPHLAIIISVVKYIYLWKVNATGHDICWPSYKSSRTTPIRFIWLYTFWCNLPEKVYFIVRCNPYIVRYTFIFHSGLVCGG